ncbi:alanyl-tRNA synthetase [Vibrio galatheae]|uniref:Alanyl-tRNA synthetase n=1 Tax=Vibrio galatheae TaxID=579748 RepID=A0A0F4NLX9_9VIBR|nr:alanyl-tRNA editing protein [Vibrio galatheae]KJY83868.1 alanyl-tRNA synthetase [Vibrio galatheae]
MMEKVFWANPYQTKLNAQVTHVNENSVELSQTIFYAESGGQESDKGTIGGIPVNKAIKRQSRIVYQLESKPNFTTGDTVEICIDWERRYALMKLHFAAEVVLELFYKHFAGIVKIGAHISQDKSRIDFEWPQNISKQLKHIELEAQRLIDADLKIRSEFSDIEDEKRFWQVDDFAKVPCGGTHLKRTSEVGRIQLKRKNLGKDKERVEISLC